MHIIAVVMVMMPMSSLFVMTMIMIVGMAMRATMRVTVMMSMLKRHYANQVYKQPDRADNEKLSHSVHFHGFNQSLYCLTHNLQTNKHQKDSVCKTGKCIDFSKTIREFSARWPLAHYRRTET